MTTAQAAALAGMTPARFRSEMTRERARGRDHRAPRDLWPDARTPLWDEVSVRAWLAARRSHPARSSPTA